MKRKEEPIKGGCGRAWDRGEESATDTVHDHFIETSVFIHSRLNK